MTSYFLLFLSAAIVNNFVLTRFLGLCIFFGVSKSLKASLGMGMAVTSIITMSSMLAWVVYNFVLLPYHLVFLKTVVFVLLIASYCVVLGVPVINAESNYNFVQSVVNAFGSGVGFSLAIIMMASIREKLEDANVPKALQGSGIAFISAGMLALAFLGFSGMIKI